jgi:hypothetical protein
MLSTVLQSLIAPHYPRRYVGRHRARLVVRRVTVAVSRKPRTAE